MRLSLRFILPLLLVLGSSSLRRGAPGRFAHVEVVHERSRKPIEIAGQHDGGAALRPRGYTLAHQDLRLFSQGDSG